ncbi:lasso peptide isopeptide bond-forming cyclase [Burkholderia pseudomallei]|uniref:lasso peptide isopeptide bond-forming cyclase n=1 Tax=Burkholderia pseudomallei TaxID=28450 RepID=UPI001AAEA94F|nr:lasso peptide isopeptide bond-forming cyclase [Burkholderia pseudomallei]MBO2952015.1 lasso peptide isopeptide bond-forming cyclase [Burkholderia pseudomallei]
MAKSIERLDATHPPPRSGWRLERRAWTDAAAHRGLLSRAAGPDRPIGVTLLEAGGRGRAYLREAPASVDRALARARTLADARDAVTRAVWGAYVAVLDEAATGRRLFLPDPLHSVRLYYRTDEDGRVDVDPQAANLLRGASIDWNLDYLIEFACTQFGPLGETPFASVRAVPPGCALVVDADGRCAIERAWLPRASAGDDVRASCAAALDEVYSRFARSHPNVCAALSGGVDSSAGAILLRKALGAQAPLAAVHLFSPSSPDCYERDLAARVADSIGARLICIDIDRHLPFSERIVPTPPATLSQDMLFLGIDRAVSRAIGASSVLLEGQGGDLLFKAVPDANAVLDALRGKGWAFALRTAEKLAVLHNDSIPRVLLMAAKIALRRRLFGQDAAEARQTMSKLFASHAPRAAASPTRMRRAGAPLDESVAMLDRFVSIMTPVTDAAYTNRLNPYLAQPVVEASFGLRSYDSFDHRNDRIVLREIAAAHTPVDVLWRRTKGSFGIGFVKGIVSHYDAFRELIRDGVLMRSGQLDEAELEHALKAVRVGQNAAAISLALVGCVEIFCASWQNFMTNRSAAIC